jgi:hypothetical protein
MARPSWALGYDGFPGVYRRQRRVLQSLRVCSSDGSGRTVDSELRRIRDSGSVTHANSGANAWWQVDLGASATISSLAMLAII